MRGAIGKDRRIVGHVQDDLVGWDIADWGIAELDIAELDLAELDLAGWNYPQRIQPLDV